MTDPLDGDRLIDVLVAAGVEADTNEVRVMAFHETVPVIEGPLGALLRQIAWAHNEFEQARRDFATTEGESNRMSSVMDEAVSLVEWLRDGGQL